MRGRAADVDADGLELDILLAPDEALDFGALLWRHHLVVVVVIEFVVVHGDHSVAGYCIKIFFAVSRRPDGKLATLATNFCNSSPCMKASSKLSLSASLRK